MSSPQVPISTEGARPSQSKPDRTNTSLSDGVPEAKHEDTTDNEGDHADVTQVSGKRKYASWPRTPLIERLRVVHYNRYCWLKKIWDEIGDVSEEDQSEIEEGRWDYWKAYYCNHDEASSSNDRAFNEIFFAWSLLYTIGMNSHQNLLHLMLQNGGLAFIVVVVIVYIGVGYPMYVLETMMGQYGSRKPLTMLRLMAPYMQGIGPALWLRTLFVAVECLVIGIYGFHYFLDLVICQINQNQLLYRFWSQQSNTSKVLNLLDLQLGLTYEPKGYLSDHGTREWMVFLFILTTVFVFVGIRTFGRLYTMIIKGMFLIWIGYLIMAVLRTFGGDPYTNIMFFPLRRAISTKWRKILSGKVWMDAVLYVISSLGLVTLVHPYFGSRCFYHYRTPRDGIFIIALTLIWNLVGAVAVLLFIGYVTVNKKEMVKALEQIGGYQGMFITYVMKINQANLVGNLEYDVEFSCGLYYAIISSSAILAFHSCLRALIQSSYQEYTSIVLAICIILIVISIFCVGVPLVFISADGLRILIHLQYYLHCSFGVIFVAACFFCSVAYSHNFAKVVYDIRNMVHLAVFQPLGGQEALCAWYPKFYRNLVMFLIFAVFSHTIFRAPYPVVAGTDYSGNPVYLGLATTSLPILFVIVVGIMACSKAKKAGQNPYRPHRDWFKNWYHTVICFTLKKKNHSEV